MRLDRVEDALANGIALEAGGIPVRLVKPNWAKFEWPGEEKVASRASLVEGFARDPETPAGAAELLEIVAAIAKHANDPIALAALGRALGGH